MARNYGGLSPYYSAVGQSLERYVPLPFQEMAQASDAIYQRAEKINEQNLATETMLANIEALAPEHRNYVMNASKNFRDKQYELLDKYGGNSSNPEYIREARRVISQAANDQNFRTILSANQQIKSNEQVARQMAANGKLYIRPDFSGVDSSGRLVDNVGMVQGVNTLDNIDAALKTAWQSMENNNRGTISNAGNLKRQNDMIKNAVINNSPEIQQVVRAYQEQGLNPEQAYQRTISELNRLSGQYAVKSERDNSYYSYQLQLRTANDQLATSSLNRKLLQAQLAGLQAKSTNGIAMNSVFKKDYETIDKNNVGKEKMAIADNLLRNLDTKGNIKSKGNWHAVAPDSSPYVDSGSPFAATTARGIPGAGSKQGIKSSTDALKYMRTELGWADKKGSAREVANAYKNMVQVDNRTPAVLTITDQTVYNATDKLFKNNFRGSRAHGLKNGVVTTENEIELQNNASLKGITLGSDGKSIVAKYISYIDKDTKNPVYIEKVLPSDWQSSFNFTKKVAGLERQDVDNTQLMKMINANPSNYIENYGSGTFVAPRKTAGGIRYAQIEQNSNGNWDFKRDSNRDLIYVDDNIVDTKLQSEGARFSSYLLNASDLIKNQ